MKFLLKQYLNFEVKGMITILRPNKFSSRFVRIAKKKGYIISEKKTWRNGYYIIDYYLFWTYHFKQCFREHKKYIIKKREKFYKKNDLSQLIQLLDYIFDRNKKAHMNKNPSAIQKAYKDKQQFLEIAIQFAKNIKVSYFSYGWTEDLECEYAPYIYYFQIKNLQVSFHSKKLIDNCPEFPYEWVGYRNLTYPFKKLKNKII
ncbi:MAG: hypothetical protein ACFFDB_00255 [Promethearchaeota archaeon]